jgi:hypothetical protein
MLSNELPPKPSFDPPDTYCEYRMQYKLLHRESKQSKIQSEKFNATIISRLLKTKSAISSRILDYGIDQDNTPSLIMDYASQEMLRNRSPKGSIVPLQQRLPTSNRLLKRYSMLVTVTWFIDAFIDTCLR